MLRPKLAGIVLGAIVFLPGLTWAQRSRGIDVSAWQGTVNWTSVRNSGVDFAFIRSTRGGTTGTYNQSTQVGTLSHRYDDPFFASNITTARSRGIHAGPYHFLRADILSYDINGTTVTHTGLDEANHMLEFAGNYMSLGYLRPVLDIEAGATQRTQAGLTDFSLAFINRIVAVKGVAPIVYVNSSYANSELDSRIAAYDLWMARYIDPTVVDVQTVVDLPAAGGLPNVYGRWNPTYPTLPAVRPWDFWQYTSTGTTPGVSGNNDLNVANGGIEFVKDFLMPALWQATAAGDWSLPANWNGNTTQQLPGPNDRVTLNRGTAATVTLATGSNSVRSYESNQPLTMTGGSLAVQQYFRTTQPVTISGGALNVTGNIESSNASVLEVSGAVQAGAIRNVQLILDASGSVTLNNAAAASTVGSLTVNSTSTARLNLGGSTLVLDFAGASPVRPVGVGAGRHVSADCRRGERRLYRDHHATNLER
jgi:GH25 family lysozyme M1 (1,4-beta-N-acetylmuramidase)